MLHGRVGELDQIDRMLVAARAGVSGALVVHGEAGIGKTALLEHAAAAAGSARVLRTVGIESEMELAFGGLHQMLRPVVDGLDRLPAPQAAALKAVFGLTGQAVRDRFTVNLAVLTLLSQAAGADDPLLCLIDDAQWLDQTSLDVLTFAARRLHSEGVVMLFAVRDGARGARITGLPRLRLAGLEPSAVDALLADRAAGLPPHVRDQIVAQADGNPLALLELPAALTAEQRAGQLNPVTLPAGLASRSSRIQDAFQEQIRQLPDATRTLLLLAAADDTGDLELILRAAAADPVTGLEDLEPAERATLIRLTANTLFFRHPLIRSAAYQDAALARRLAAHRALAGQLSGAPHADRRAWHLAAATTGTDESVCEEMAGVARRAGGRQGVSSASAAYERAAQLTADPARRARLLAAAAINAAEAGQFQRTGALADRINALALDPATLADFARVRSIVELDHGSPRQATRILLECVDRIGSGPDLLPLLSYAVHIVSSTGDRALMAEVWSRLPDEPRYATMRALTGPPEALEGAAIPSAHRHPAPGAGFAERILAGALAQFVADHRAAFDIAAACVADCRTQDVVGWLHSSLYLLGEAQLAMGLYEDAAASAGEGLTVAEHDGRDHRATYLRATLATVAALTGAEERCRSLAATVLDHADRHGIEAAAAHAHRALGVLELGLGQAGSALEHLEAARRRVDHPLPAAFFLPDLVEAAVRARRHDRLDEPVAQLTQWAAAAGTAASAALARRCQALTAPDDAAEEHFTAAIDQHCGDADPQPFEQARTQLLYGEWLRRARRRSDARRHLRDALETFDRLGAAPWSHRAGTELKATGGSATEPGDHDSGLLSRLSPQEREVVRLAATGATNREIAAQLFLSPRTVGHHLYRAYPKLGITSRTELSQVVD